MCFGSMLSLKIEAMLSGGKRTEQCSGSMHAEKERWTEKSKQPCREWV